MFTLICALVTNEKSLDFFVKFRAINSSVLILKSGHNGIMLDSYNFSQRGTHRKRRARGNQAKKIEGYYDREVKIHKLLELLRERAIFDKEFNNFHSP